ncbi:hypothetical protein COMNV_00878 [Commensalibacter sp. Nvir]|uniref:Tim44 domain-containing protein n=1 Tax=Commensalibacter sp. Nvir TaxID=3069817 RepID=UPI002D55AE61|nr:hypothetical protein COMNV_00878 [Commensalibacter sp. Nvir]
MNCTTNLSRTLLCLLSLFLLTPTLILSGNPQAEARAGRGLSMGSRGSRTFQSPLSNRLSPFGAYPTQITMTRPPVSTPFNGGFGNAVRKPAAPNNNAFTRGLIGGAIGAAGYHMLAGHKESRAQSGAINTQPKFSAFNFLLRIFFIGLLFWLGLRFFQGLQQKNKKKSSGFFSRTKSQNTIQLTKEDYLLFQTRLIEIQDAWNKQDLIGLQKFATPEMVAYFHEQLTDLASKGLRNTTSEVQFIQGDLSESWTESGRDYATVTMQYSLIDVTTNRMGQVVEGNPNQKVQIKELWTFVRASGSQWWLLSAIQQSK